MCLSVKAGMSDDVGSHLSVVPIMHCWKWGGGGRLLREVWPLLISHKTAINAEARTYNAHLLMKKIANIISQG